ncbi:MAG: ScpA family protein [Candidatus ainarchaeum sp.]|nr:ScpA family protein [Candidatus ainarchaeum sp.]
MSDLVSILPIQDETEFERDYSKIDLVDLIEQPAWKSILIDLVKSNKMDPWDIDVSLLTEKYIDKINNLESSSLRVPANAILACAILVKTKSRYLKLSSIEEDDIELGENSTLVNENLFIEIPDLVASRSMRDGRISLDELVQSIEGIIQNTTPSKKYNKPVLRMDFDFNTTSIEERLEEVFNLVKQSVDSQGLVMFKSLLNDNQTDTIVDTFLPILFLMNSGKLLAYQEEFFGDIFVKLIQDDININ